MRENRQVSDHLAWLVPVLLLGGISLPIIVWAGGDGSALLDLVIESVAVFAAAGVVLVGLALYSLHRTRLLLFLSLSFLAAGLINFLHVVVVAAAIGYDVQAQISFMPDTWAVGRASLAALLLLGLVFNRFAPVVERAGVEVVVATIVVVTMVATVVLLLALIDLPMSQARVPGIEEPGQLWIGVLFLIALPPYFHLYRRWRNYLWLSVVICVVFSVFGQFWAALSTEHSSVSTMAAHAAELGSYVTVLLGFQLLGVHNERAALAASLERGLILEVARVASEAGWDVRRMVGRVARAVASVLDVVRVAILLPEPDGEALRVVGGHDTRYDFAPRVDARLSLADFPGLAQAIRESVVVHFPVDEQHVLEKDSLEELWSHGIGAVAVVPLVTGGRGVGLVALSSPDRRWRLNPEDEALALAIAGQVAAILENARLLALFERQATVQTTLLHAVVALNADLGPDEVLAEIADQLRRALDAEVCAIADWDPWREILTHRLEKWRPGSSQRPPLFSLSEYPMAHRALENQQTIVINTQEPRREHAAEQALLQAFGLRSLLLLPLIAKGVTIGLVAVYDSHTRHYLPHEIELAEVLSQQAGVALHRARLLDLERDRAAQLSVLNWLANVVSGPIPQEATLDESARRLALALPDARAVLIYARQPDRKTFQLSASTGLPDPLTRRRTIRRVLSRRVEAVLSPERPVDIPHSWDGSSPTALAQAAALLELDPLGGVGVYVEGELTLLILLSFAPESLPGERENDFLLTLSASLSQSLTSQRLFENVAAERERLRAILSSTGEGVILTSRRGEIILLNPAAERLFGFDTEAARGRALEEVLPQEAFKSIVARVRRGEIEDLERTSIVLSDGLALLVSIAPVRMGDGQIRSYVIDMADVTALQTLSEQKSQVLRMASHDLLNPLGQAMGGFELLIEDLPTPLDPLTQQVVKNIREGHDRMSRLIKSLLDLERLEAGALGERSPVSVETLLQEVMREIESLAAEHEHHIELDLPAGLPDVDVAFTHMHRALCNLVENAVKYTPPGGRIQIEARSVEGGVAIAVADNGIGIAREDQSRLFQRFYRVHQPGTENVSGTGLGLNLVKSVVELHGGRVSVESDAGVGSTFTVTLPAAHAGTPE